MAILNAERVDRLEGPSNMVVTTWKVPECNQNQFCYAHLDRPDYIIDKCPYYDYVDERGLHCKRPNSLNFFKEIRDGF